jgi:uncharacterized membrane protein required for colicin V production
MELTSTDIVLGLIIGGAFLLGFFWGVIRSLLMFGSWFVVFLVSAYLAEPLGEWLEKQWTNLSPDYNRMAAFMLLYLVGLVLAFILVHVGTRGVQGLTRWPFLDDIAGAVLCAATAILGIAGVIIIFRTFFGASPGTDVILGPSWVLDVYRALLESQIGSAIAENLVPLLGTVLGPVLPQPVREAMV